MCIWVCVCSRRFARFVYVSYWFSTNTHTHEYALAHTHTYRRWWEERHIEEVGGRTKERKKITSNIGAQDDCYAVCSTYDCWGQKRSRISFRSDDDVPLSGTFTQLRRDDFFLLLLHHLSFTAPCDSLSFYRYTITTITLIGFFAIIWMCMCVCISRDHENVPCFTAIDGRLDDLVCACASSPKAPNKKRDESEKKQTHACMKARRCLIIDATSETQLSRTSREAADIMSNVSISRSDDINSKHCARKKFHLETL
jgi:hypothetical protein